MERLEIPLSKKKIMLGLCGSVLFVVFGVYMLTTLADEQSRYHPLWVKGVGVAGILFFGATAVYGFRKLFDKRAGLIVDADGITDNTNAVSIGLIPWSDIIGIETRQVMSTRFLLIFTTHPFRYLDRAGGLAKRLMAANMRMYGTPVAITSTTLKYDFGELKELLQWRLDTIRNS